VDNDRDIGKARRGPQAAADAPPAVATPTGPGDDRHADSAAVADESRWRRLVKLLIDRVPVAASVQRWFVKLTVGPIAQAVQRVAKVTLALVALVVALDLVGALQATTHGLVESRWIGPAKQKSEWIKAARQATMADTAIRRLMTVQLDRDTLTVTYDLWLPPGHDLFRAVQDGQANSNSAWLVHDVLGDVRVGEFPQGLPNSRRTSETTLSFDPPLVQTTTAEGHLRLTSKPYWFSLPALQVSVDKPAAVDAPVDAGELPGGLPLTADRAVVRSDRLQVFRQEGPAPVWQSNERAEFDRLGSEQVLRFTVTEPGASGLRSALFGMGGASLPVLAGLQGRFALLLVIIALLRWLQAAGERFGPLEDIVRAIFVYVLALAVVGAIADATWSLAWYPRPLATRLMPDVDEPKQVGAFALTIVAAAMLWPLMVARTHRRLSAVAPAEIRPQATVTREASRATAIDNGAPRSATADQGHAAGTVAPRPANADGNAHEQRGRRVVKALVIAALAMASALIALAAAEEPVRPGAPWPSPSSRSSSRPTCSPVTWPRSLSVDHGPGQLRRSSP
jgi:hypothetical protein